MWSASGCITLGCRGTGVTRASAPATWSTTCRRWSATRTCRSTRRRCLFATCPRGDSAAAAKPPAAAPRGDESMAEAVGFFTDTTICIGCKACQVACHQWNDLPAGRMGLPVLSGNSYDNTGSLSDVNWRHVKFIEQFSGDANRSSAAWLMMSDVCKHCVNAPCLEVCPTGAILRTEFDTVFINEPTCN